MIFLLLLERKVPLDLPVLMVLMGSTVHKVLLVLPAQTGKTELMVLKVPLVLPVQTVLMESTVHKVLPVLLVPLALKVLPAQEVQMIKTYKGLD